MFSFKHYLKESKKWRAGGFPYYEDENGDIHVCLFISNDPNYGGPHPQIPKGNPDPGENASQAASREASEETGIPLTDLRKNAQLVIVRSFKGQVADYDIHVYSFKLDRKIPARTTEEGKGVWLSLDRAMSSMRKDQRIFLQDFKELHRIG